MLLWRLIIKLIFPLFRQAIVKLGRSNLTCNIIKLLYIRNYNGLLFIKVKGNNYVIHYFIKYVANFPNSALQTAH